MTRIHLSAILTHIEKWATVVAALAQVAMLVLVWYGYEYTVKPVFEMNLLQERVAELELQKNNLTSKNNDLARHFTTQANTLAIVNSELRDSELKISNTNSKLSSVESQYALSKRSLRAVKGQLLHYNSQLRHAQIVLMSVLFSTKLLFVQLSDSQTLTAFADLDRSDAAELIRKSWPNPYEDMLDALKQIEAKNAQASALPKWLISDTKEFIAKNKINLQCHALDFDKVVAEYRHAKALADQHAEQQLPEYLAKVIKEQSKPNTIVEITPEFKNQSLEELKAAAEFKINNTYTKKLIDARQKCSQKAWTVYEAFTKVIGAPAY